MVSSLTASRGQVTNSPSSCLYPLLKRGLLRHFVYSSLKEFCGHQAAENLLLPTCEKREVKSSGVNR
jgi:hypothetical protein